MSGINKVILVGNVGHEPEVKAIPSGGSLVSFSIATSDNWKDKVTGEQKERTEWHKVAVFGKLAEIAGNFLRKGSKVYVEGQLRTRKWQDQQGHDRYTTEVVLQGFNGVLQLLDKKSDSSDSGPNMSNQTTYGSSLSGNTYRTTESGTANIKTSAATGDLDWDDVPF